MEEWELRYNDTRSLFPIVLDQLSDYNMKLSDLQEALDQARDYVRQTEDTNKKNAGKLQENEVLCSSMYIVSVSVSNTFSLTRTF